MKLLKLLKTKQHHHHAAFRAQPCKSTVTLCVWMSFNPNMLCRNIWQKQLQDWQHHHHRLTFLHKPSPSQPQLRNANSNTLWSSKLPGTLADRWQSNLNTGTGQGRGKTIRGTTFTRQTKNNSSREKREKGGGGEKTARAIERTRQERKQSHRPDRRKSWILAQSWVLPLTHPPQPWVLETEKEREGGRGRGWQRERKYYEIKIILDKKLSRCISNICLNTTSVIRCWLPAC